VVGIDNNNNNNYIIVMSNETTTQNQEAKMATTIEQVKAVKVGGMAPDCFGRMAEVVEINHRGLDIHGKLFVHYYVKFGETSRISNSIKEGRVESFVN